MQKLRGSNFKLDDGTLYNKQTVSENVTIQVVKSTIQSLVNIPKNKK